MPSTLFVPPLEGRSKDTVRDCVSSRRLPNGLILLSGDPLAAEKTARYLAAGVVCGEDSRPCGACENCRKIMGKLSQDVIDVLPEDGRQGVNVDAIREVRADAYITPGELDIKVYIIHDADKMNAAAQNALLKVLEEPPSAVHFILLCSNTAALLPTVRSRCWTIILSSKESQTASEKKNADLAMRTITALTGNRRSEVEGMISDLPDDRSEYRGYILALMKGFRNISAAKAGRTEALPDDDAGTFLRISRQFSDAALIRAYEQAHSALTANDANINILTSQAALLAGLWNSIYKLQ